MPRKPGSTRRRQNLGFIAGGLIASACLAVLLAPGQERWHAFGPMNVGHQELHCPSCHKPAPGSTRQQIQANVRYWLGLRATPADFGKQAVGNDICLRCHDRPDDRHPVFRFFEPRFAEARAKLQPQFCNSCHLEHSGVRVTQPRIDYCQVCHEETKLKKDPLDVPHTQLIAQKRWTTCLGCHDFHGNHPITSPKLLAQVIPPERIRDYFGDGASPYGKDKRHAAKKEAQNEF